MPRVTADFSQIEEFEVMDKGEYEAIIEMAEYRQSSEEGKFDNICLHLKITEEGFENRKQWLYLSFSPRAMFKMKEVFENLGIIEEDEEIEIDYDDEVEPMIVTEPELAGIPCIAVVTKGKYEGRDTNNVATLLPLEKAVGKNGKKAEPKAAGKKKDGEKKTTGRRKFQ